jgi:hypothetical protein
MELLFKPGPKRKWYTMVCQQKSAQTKPANQNAPSDQSGLHGKDGKTLFMAASRAVYTTAMTIKGYIPPG